jgi:hypothetical protein
VAISVPSDLLRRSEESERNVRGSQRPGELIDDLEELRELTK